MDSAMHGVMDAVMDVVMVCTATCRAWQRMEGHLVHAQYDAKHDLVDPNMTVYT